MFDHPFIDHHMLLALGQYFFCRSDQTIQHKKYDYRKYKSNKHLDTPFPGNPADDLKFHVTHMVPRNDWIRINVCEIPVFNSVDVNHPPHSKTGNWSASS
jgi:hypothetical protein